MEQPIQQQKKILIIDIGTSSIRVSLIDETLAIRDTELYKRNAEITFDGEAEWSQIKSMIQRLAKRIPDMNEIEGISASSLLGWICVDKMGHATTPCYSYMHQGRGPFDRFAAMYSNEEVYSITGRRMNPELGAFQLLELQELDAEAYLKSQTLLSLKDFINLKLTGQTAMDHTTACYTMVYDIHQADWSSDLIRKLHLDATKLPKLLRPYEKVGTLLEELSMELGLPAGIRVACGSVDGSVGILGAGGYRKGQAVSVMGTTDVCFMIDNAALYDKTQSLVVNPHVIPDRWLIGGPMGMFGGTVDWLIRNLLLGRSTVEELTQLASLVPPGSDGVQFIPTLLGERTPFWNPNMRGTIAGLTPSHGMGHLFRAIMESNSFSLRKIMELAGKAGLDFDEMIAIGGGSKNRLWLHIRADILRKPVCVSPVTEATSIGSALLVMMMNGLSTEELPLPQFLDRIQPDENHASHYDVHYTNYLAFQTQANSLYDL